MSIVSRANLVPATLMAGAALITGGIIFEPQAAGAMATIQALVTCSASSPCVEWKNSGSGPAIQGTAASSNGIHGYSGAKAKAGVLGETTSTTGGYGVRGNNTNANGVGVYASGGSGIGLQSVTTSGFGIYDSTTSGYGIYATSSSGIGVDAFSGSSFGLAGGSSTNLGLYVDSASATTSAMEADNYGTTAAMFGADGGHIYSYSGNGAVIANGAYTVNGINAVVGQDSVRFGAVIGGKSFGLMTTTGAGTAGYPLEASSANSSGTVTGFFYVDGSGSVHYTGSLQSYAHTRGGSSVTAYETKATRASVEDSGTAQLVGGSAVVTLDPAYAQSIDLTTPYRVFLTPNGDTRGLYVAQKTATGFIVRETQGGHGTFGFDYRILAGAAGGTGERMTAVTPTVQSKFFPMLNTHGATSTYTGLTARPAIPAAPLASP